MWSLLNLHQAQAIDNEPFSSLSTDLPKRAKDLGKLKQELLELDRTLDRGTVLRQRLQLGQVPGFNFPVATKQEVIRLEQAVVANRSVRHQYVRFLDTRLNESKMNVSKCLSLCFQNEALINFEWNRERNMRNDRVKIIGSFHIFTTCMRDAWKRYGITENIIEREIKRKLVLIKSNK